MVDSPLSRAQALVIASLAVLGVLFAVGIVPGVPWISPVTHTVVVGSMAAVVFIAALVTWRAAWTRFDVRSALVSGGFTAMGGLLVVHALATPGGPVFAPHDHNPTVQIAGVMSVPAGALLIALAMVMPPRRVGSRRMMAGIQASVIAGVAAFAAVGFAMPEVIPQPSLMQPPVSWYVLVPTCVVLAVAVWRARAIAELTNRPEDAAIVTGVAWLAVAVLLYVTSTPMDMQFWAGHVFELLGFVAVTWGIAHDVAKPRSSWRLTTEVDGSALVASSEELLGGYVHALTVTLAEVDPDTWEHSRRVAELAVDVGHELGLSAQKLQRIAVAGLVHDIGKLRVPRDILQKPAKLTDEEFDIIREHPGWGEDILQKLRGFGAEIPIVRSHHEKLSGRGYPDGLTASELSLEVRIMTACDVYDALTGERSYKSAWPMDRALSVLHEEAGTSFDPEVVAALEAVVRRRTTSEERVIDMSARRVVVPGTAPIEDSRAGANGGEPLVA